MNLLLFVILPHCPIGKAHHYPLDFHLLILLNFGQRIIKFRGGSPALVELFLPAISLLSKL